MRVSFPVFVGLIQCVKLLAYAYIKCHRDDTFIAPTQSIKYSLHYAGRGCSQLAEIPFFRFGTAIGNMEIHSIQPSLGKKSAQLS